MKASKLMAVTTGVALWSGVAAAQVLNTFTFNVGQGLPDGDASGMALSANLTGMIGVLTDVSVTLDIAGGFNGDLYGYLVHDSGFAVLLNRVGVSASDASGYGDPGFSSVHLSGSALTDVHLYGGNAGVALTGTFQPDARNVDPITTAGTGFDAAARDATLSSFDNLSPNGDWVFFLADVSAGGGQATLNSWGLELTTVPEPASSCVLLGLVGLGFAGWARRRAK
jgi:MYXO-CTERM domain-containing protein